MVNEILDLSFLIEVTNNDKTHVSNVIDIFIESTDKALKNMDKLIHAENWYELSRQAHAIKSSLHVINIIGMHEQILFIEKNAETNSDKKIVTQSVTNAKKLYKRAKPLLVRLQKGEDIL
jgi:HPt (histidine-containing phosphotransfer) domain-containing protein